MNSRVVIDEAVGPLLAEEAPAAAVPRAGWVSLAYLSLGHFFIDFYSNALGAFVPLLVDKLGITLIEAGFLGGLLSFSSSVTQPVYGYLSDRFKSPLFATLAPAVAGIFIASLGIAPSYAWLIALVFLGGAGVASFHPAGSSRVIANLAPERRQMAMAIFISCGSLGLACGPSAFSYLFDTVGMSRAYLAAVPGILTTLVLLFFLPKTSAPSSHRKVHKFDLKELMPVWWPLTILYLCVFLRSVVQITFSALLPLYLHKERGYPLSEASHLLSYYLAAGALGGFIGGNMASRFGGKRVIQISFLGSLPLLALFFLSSGWIAMTSLILGGFVLFFTVPVNVVMAQELAPTQAGTVSALMMGAAWGMAGLIGIPLVGWVGDHYSLHKALASLVVAPLLGWLLTLLLKTGTR
jgi:FSR family fosmidomycin resistance protein-like MFS transporter